MKNQSRLAAALAVSLLAACSGGGGTPSMPQLPNTTAPVAVQPSPGTPAMTNSTAQFAISVPHAVPTPSSARRPQYVSPNTGSVRISILSADGVPVKVPDTIAAIAYGATGCTTNNSQPLTCAISVSAPTGHIVAFNVSTYQSNNGTGAVLSTALVSAPVVAAKLNTIPIALGGVPASMALSPAALPLVADNQLHIFHFTVNALDASGATIVGATPLANPVTLAISGDTNSALQLSTTNVTTPGQAIQLNYNGKVALDDATMTASSGSLTTSLRLAPLHVSPMSAKMMPNGKTLPVTVHEGGFTGQFSATFGDPTLATMSVGATSAGTATITLTSATAAQGTTTITISDGTSTVSVPFIVAPVLFNYFTAGLQQMSLVEYITNGPNGKVWFTDQGYPNNGIGSIDPSTGAISEYSYGAGLLNSDAPNEIAAGPDGNLYVTDDITTSILLQLNPSTGQISHITTDPNPGLTYGITAGTDHNIWFSDEVYGAPAIGVFNLTTLATKLYPVPSNLEPTFSSLTFGPDGRIWFTDWLSNTIGAMDPNNNYNVTLYAGAYHPENIINGPDGNLWFTDSAQGGSVGMVVPSSGAITLYPIGASGPRTAVPTDIVSAHGKLWVIAQNWASGGSSVGSFDPATHQFVDYSFGISKSSSPWQVVLGPDNELWAADQNMIDQIIIP